MSNIPGSDQEPRELVQPTFAGEATNIRRAVQLLRQAQALMQNDSGSYPTDFPERLCDACDSLDHAIGDAVKAGRKALDRLDEAQRSRE